jgi:biotin transport system substrate-specific component
MNSMQEFSVKEQGLQSISAPRLGVKHGLVVVAATALIAICAHISVPLGFTPVPITMQPFAVLLLGLVLTPQTAFATMVLYLMEGALGLPVFTPQGPGGVAQLLGPTGGYLLSYLMVAPLASWLYRRWGQSFLSALGSAGLASLVILSAGSVWLAVLTHAGLSAILMQSVVPFLPGDVIKVVAAAACVTALRSFTKDFRNRTI